MCATDGIIYPGYPYGYDDKNMIILPDIEEQTGNITQDCLKTLVVFVGGCADDLAQPVLRWVFPDYESAYGRGPTRIQDVCYSEYGCGKVPPVIQKWFDAKQKIVLVGHSWGGNGVVELAEENQNITIELLVTLDPVSRSKGGDEEKPGNVKRWLNVYVDYDVADHSMPNMVARTGGPWGKCINANENTIVNISESKDKNGNIIKTTNALGHADAAAMFMRVKNEVIKL